MGRTKWCKNILGVCPSLFPRGDIRRRDGLVVCNVKLRECRWTITGSSHDIDSHRYIYNDKEEVMLKEIQVGKYYKTRNDGEVYIMHWYGGDMEENAEFRYIAMNSEEGSVSMHNSKGRCVGTNRGSDIVFDKTITIDGKEITISHESFEQLKQQLLED